MHDQLQMARNKEEQIVLHHADVATIPADDWYEAPCTLDGSIESMGECLEALATLTCQDANEYHVPVLELQFGEIVTMTSVLTVNECGYLSITAFLPRPTGNVPQSTAHLSMSAVIDGTKTLLWHADKGCYVIVRKLPISLFSDERSVLDAIADTSDEAVAWQASTPADIPGE